MDSILLAYFPCFQIIKVSLFYHAVCVSTLTDFRMAEPTWTHLTQQSVCPYVYPAIVSRQRLCEKRYRGNVYTRENLVLGL
jgi:hypothetical protein